MEFETKCLHSGYSPKSGDPNVMPIMASTTFEYETAEEMAYLFDDPKSGHIYSRISNPTCSALEQKLADLEGGSIAVCCASGMSAIFLSVLTVASAGDNIISTATIYGGTHNLFKITLPKQGITTRFITAESTDEEIESLIDQNTRMLFGETLANPMMTPLDFERYAAICKKHNLLFVVDNTLATPYLIKPIEYGANVVIHSSTKYLDGHAVALGGIVVDGGNFNFKNNSRYASFNIPDESYHGEIYADEGVNAFALKLRMQYMRDIGAIMSPFNAFLTNLGTETLAVRMDRISQNAMQIAQFLQSHEAVSEVDYLGLPSYHYHDIALKYFTKGLYSGMVTFKLKGGRKKAESFINNLKLIRQLTHIADVRTCVLCPAITTHRQLSDSDLVEAGISDSFVRLSIGLENVEDLLSDLTQALQDK